MRIIRSILMLLSLAAIPCVAQTNWGIVQTLHVGGQGSWDYVTVDAANHRLFVTRATHTQAIDTDSGKLLGDIVGQIKSHGVALVPRLNRGFITDGGGAGAIVVFDLKTYAVLGKLAAMPDADGIIYDAKLDRVLAVSGDGNALMSFSPDVDPTTGKIDPPIQLGGAPEFLASDGSGKIFVNLEDKNVVAVVDLNSRSVVARWPVAPAGRPVGMSIDVASHRLFIGCRSPQKLVVMNDQTGKIEASLPIGAGVDATANVAGVVFASAGDGTLTVAGEKAGAFDVLQTVQTPTGSKTMGLNADAHRIYLPAAEFEPAVAGARPKQKPDSFSIVVVGQH